MDVVVGNTTVEREPSRVRCVGSSARSLNRGREKIGLDAFKNRARTESEGFNGPTRVYGDAVVVKMAESSQHKRRRDSHHA